MGAGRIYMGFLYIPQRHGKIYFLLSKKALDLVLQSKESVGSFTAHIDEGTQ